MKNIAVLASGGGTDFQSVIDANKRENFCVIKYLIASKEGIGAIERAKREGIKTAVFAKKDYPDLEDLYAELAALLNSEDVDYIVLAGWLKIIPASFTEKFKDRIINIHPALIPAFCGKGYYGLKVHEAAIEYGVKVSGATVHFVEADVDAGAGGGRRHARTLTGARFENRTRNSALVRETPLRRENRQRGTQSARFGLTNALRWRD